MEVSLTRKSATKKSFLIVAAATAVILCGCSQETSTHYLGAGQTRLLKVNDEVVTEATLAETPPIKAATFLATGQLLEAQGNFVEAAKLYQRACRTRLDYVAAWNRLGIVCDKLGRYKQAEESFDQAIRHAPNVAFLHNNLGFSCLLAGKYDQAQKHLQRALELNGQFQRARVNLGLALAKQGKTEEALTELKKALPVAQAYYNMGYIHRQASEWEQAANCYKLALELDPGLTEAQTSLAMCEQGYTSEK